MSAAIPLVITIGPPAPVTVDARTFSAVPHAGTMADPWPGSAIQQALLSLPPTGGTVTVADGIWLFDAALQVNGVNNFSLIGQSRNAQLVFTGVGQLWFNEPSVSGGPIVGMKATIATLTINANGLPVTSGQAAMRLSNFQNASLNNTQIMGCANGSVPAVFFEGGVNNQVTNNSVIAGPQGGTVLQFDALGQTPNSGYLISQNTFDSCILLMIGLDNSTISHNTFGHQTLGNSIGIEVCGTFTGTTHNVTIDSNTVDATLRQNDAYICGISNDSGGMSNIDGFNITNNILKGTACYICLQTNTPSQIDNIPALGTKSHVTVTGNQISSLWTGSLIDISGGTSGAVDTVLVESNTLQNSANAANTITQDSHTTNATVTGNTL